MSGVLDRSRIAVAVSVVAVLALVTFLGTTGASADGSARGLADTQEVEITLNERGFPKFDTGDGTIAPDGTMTVVNATNPRQIGPHTVSLVPASLIPRTTAERRRCFARGEICRAIAGWHGATANRPPTIKSVEAGGEGWDTQGDLDADGDSFFTEEKGEKHSREVTVPVNKSIHFICAVHPGMNGKLKVETPAR